MCLERSRRDGWTSVTSICGVSSRTITSGAVSSVNGDGSCRQVGPASATTVSRPATASRCSGRIVHLRRGRGAALPQRIESLDRIHLDAERGQERRLKTRPGAHLEHAVAGFEFGQLEAHRVDHGTRERQPGLRLRRHAHVGHHQRRRRRPHVAHHFCRHRPGRKRRSGSPRQSDRGLGRHRDVPRGARERWPGDTEPRGRGGNGDDEVYGQAGNDDLFGGAGGLHVCALADALQMQRALVPANAGVLSALGMLAAEPSRERSITIKLLLKDCNTIDIEEQFKQSVHWSEGDRALAGPAGEVRDQRRGWQVPAPLADVDLDGQIDIVGGGRWFKHQGGTRFAPQVIDEKVTALRLERVDDAVSGLKRSLLLILKSPRFLYPTIEQGERDGYDTAACLALGLWDSLPDERLLQAAATGASISPYHRGRQ